MRIPEPPRWVVTLLIAACLILLLYSLARSAGFVTVCRCDFHNVYNECIRWACQKVELRDADRPNLPMRRLFPPH
jgi:hypothetical protein